MTFMTFAQYFSLWSNTWKPMTFPSTPAVLCAWWCKNGLTHPRACWSCVIKVRGLKSLSPVQWYWNLLFRFNICTKKATAGVSLFHTLQNSKIWLVWRYEVLWIGRKSWEWWIMDKRWRMRKGLTEENLLAELEINVRRRKKQRWKKKKSRVCYDVLQPEVMIYFSKFREVSLFFILGNFNNMLLI